MFIPYGVDSVDFQCLKTTGLLCYPCHQTDRLLMMKASDSKSHKLKNIRVSAGKLLDICKKNIPKILV